MNFHPDKQLFLVEPLTLGLQGHSSTLHHEVTWHSIPQENYFNFGTNIHFLPLCEPEYGINKNNLDLR